MPAVGSPNNPGGVNGWDGFGTEEPYGQVTQNAQLQRGAPMAGAAVASGPIQAAKRAGRQAVRGASAPQAAPTPPEAQPLPPPTDTTYDARLAQYWQAIAAIPGASDLVKTYAALATQRMTGG